MPDFRSFQPENFERELTAILGELAALEDFGAPELQRVLRRYPKNGCGLFSKSDLVRGFRFYRDRFDPRLGPDAFMDRLRMKPVRTISGVAPVTVLTKPFPCPGRCIFCPSDVRMPKSYLSDEPGAQRAAQHQFDPYLQTLSRLQAYYNNGHPVDKIELIILGGTWSHYPEGYQIWFIKRCFDAMNEFSSTAPSILPKVTPDIDFRDLHERVNGRSIARNYNQVVNDFADTQPADLDESAGWAELECVQRLNETTEARCVGLVVETRPDHLTLDEAVRIRRLGATKVQIGYQSLSDEVLQLNHRGHDVAATRRAMVILRQAGFKIHAHWMPNLYGSDPEKDIADYERIFADPDFRPDELKIYPCSLIESAELMAYYERGEWRPYEYNELLHVLTTCMRQTPGYCRLTRVIRDIPGTDIVKGNRLTNFRELAERELESLGESSGDIRAREIRDEKVDNSELRLETLEYGTAIGREQFLQFVTREGRIAAFLRLSLPVDEVPIAEIRHAAMIREVHVYGRLVSLGRRREGRSQHLGLGRRLVAESERRAAEAGYKSLAVISSIGTREYYRRLGFEDGILYQAKSLAS
ncbi:MAG: tRNA uridine(34) 5-carboxymethylaminomethyl modification radical SAM/GNAT enzyme Elp3 [Acidobacteria bacterium]|nr:tRNA uridine(34) 5-carboxymethylaminomethyl modification radical SAM/GNAT enzyme Elp3 [Acidobacteriota bacterium]